MRRLARALGIAVALGLLWLIGQTIASESGEVVVVRSFDAGDQAHETRLWIVDDGGTSWLRAGTGGAGWYARLRERPELEVVRGGETLRVRGLPEPAARDRINALMRAKYGWADAWISLVAARERAVAIRLEPR